MNQGRFAEIVGRFSNLRVAVVGDYFLDRYLIIDPSKTEVSIETGLPVHNVISVRSQPGAAGTVVNNLAALGVGTIHAVGFCGEDGEGYELQKSLRDLGLSLENFLVDRTRRTPVYCKPLVVSLDDPPRELSRFDSKNWDETPTKLGHDLATRVERLASQVDAMILIDQVGLPETGVVTRWVRDAAHAAQQQHENLVILADSRRGLAGYPPIGSKMNAAEYGRTVGTTTELSLQSILDGVCDLALRNCQPVFVSLAENGLIGADRDGEPEHVPAFAVRGPIDIVGAGDCVTASLAASLAAGSSLREAMEIAMAAASIVVHQLGTTGTATLPQIESLLNPGFHEASSR